MHKLRSLVSVALLAGLTACGDSGLEIYSRFDNSQDISEGAAVYFNDKSVGEVVDVAPKDDGTFVTMALDPQTAEKISPHAAVVVNRLKPGAPLEIHNGSDVSNLGLEAGQKLQGLDSMMGLVAWSVGDALKVGTNELSGYVNSFKDYLNSEQFEQDKSAVQSQLQEATRDTVAAIKEVDKEINTAIEEAQINEQEIASAIEELGEEMSPVVEELASNGAKLAQELERFAKGLEEQSAERQESGTQFLESLIATLEKLNASMEKGFAEGNRGDSNDTPSSTPKSN